MLRLAAARGGGPGRRWNAKQGPRVLEPQDLCILRIHGIVGEFRNIYPWNHLHYCDDIFPYDDIFQATFTASQERQFPDAVQSRAATKTDTLSGALIKDFAPFLQLVEDSTRGSTQLELIADSSKDSTLRTHGCQNPTPVVCPKPAVEMRLQTQTRRCQKGVNQVRYCHREVSSSLQGFKSLHCS